MSHKHYEDPVLDDSTKIAEDIEVDESEETVEDENGCAPVHYALGVVTDCLKLNIRKSPDKDSEVAAIVQCLDELRIDTEASTDDWYAVCTAAGIEGFCMKKFVAVRQ